MTSGDLDSETYHIDQVTIDQDDQELAEQARRTMMLHLAQRKPPPVVIDFADELDLAKFCETVWPGDRCRRIRANIERERKDGWPPEVA